MWNSDGSYSLMWAALKIDFSRVNTLLFDVLKRFGSLKLCLKYQVRYAIDTSQICFNIHETMIPNRGWQCIDCSVVESKLYVLTNWDDNVS